MKTGEPSSKTKYYIMSDRVKYREGMLKRSCIKTSEIDPETLIL